MIKIRLLNVFVLLLMTNNCLRAENDDFKLTMVIDPGKDENYESLRAKSEEIFKLAYASDVHAHDGVKSFEIRLETVNAARPGEAQHWAQEDNPLRITRQKVCAEILSGSVAVILLHPKEEKSLASATAYALGFYKVPVISVSSRDVEFSDKNVYSTFLRTLPPYSEQAEVWFQLMIKLNYHKAIFVYPDEPNALALKANFLKLSSEKIDCNFIEYETNMISADNYVKTINASNVNVILFYASELHATKFFQSAKEYGLANSSRLWVVNDEALKAPNAPAGLLGVKLNATAEQLTWTALTDGYRTVLEGLRNLKAWADDIKVNITPPVTCESKERADSSIWKSKIGGTFYQLLTKVHIVNPTTKSLIAYDEAGDRIGFRYSLVNVDGVEYTDAQMTQASSRLVGQYATDTQEYAGFKPTEGGLLTALHFLLNESMTIWPARRKEKPPNFTLKRHLQVVTVSDPPFVMNKTLAKGETCESAMPASQAPWVYCQYPAVNDKPAIDYCCSGLSIDLLVSLANSTSFTFDLHLSIDRLYGKKNISENGKHTWNGVVSELMSGVDMAVAALTINEERDQVIDFSKPWLYHGITILEQKKPRLSPMESFMQPFKLELWVTLFSSVIGIGFVLFLLDKYSPFSRFYTLSKGKDSDDDEQPLNFSGSMWFVWGVLLDSGIGERTPRSLSARVMGMVWCGFSMIMVASYTANLAAFLVLDQPQKSLTGISDTRLRNPTTAFNYCTVDSSNVHSYFKNQVELQTMHRTMEGKNALTSEQAILDLEHGKIQAFIWDSTRLEYEVRVRPCKFITSGEIFGRSAYGIGLPKYSDWTPVISLAILQMHESGEMENLHSKWITGQTKARCEDDDDTPVRLGLTNMRDLFILVAGGIVLGFCFITVEIVYKRRKQNRLKRKQLGLHYGRLWRSRTRERMLRKQSTACGALGVFPSASPHHFGPTTHNGRGGRIRHQSDDSTSIGWCRADYASNGAGGMRLYEPLPVEYATFYPPGATESPYLGGRRSQSHSPAMAYYDTTVNPHETLSSQHQQEPLLPPAPPPPACYGEYQAYVPRRAVIV